MDLLGDPFIFNKLSMKKEDKLFAYRGANSKNSMLKNYWAGHLSKKALGAISKTQKQLSEKKIRDLARQKGIDYVPTNEKGLASLQVGIRNNGTTINPKLLLSKGNRNLKTINHEIGHHAANQDPKSFNRLHNQNIAFDVYLENTGKRLTPESQARFNEDKRIAEIKSEREAEIMARKLKGSKESRRDRWQRKLALNTYERNNEFEAQMDKGSEDPEFKKKLMADNTKFANKVSNIGGAVGAVGGAGLGAGAGAVTAKLMNRKLKARAYYLKNKKNLNPKERTELSDLERKIKVRKRLGMGIGAVAGGIGGGIGGYKVANKQVWKPFGGNPAKRQKKS